MWSIPDITFIESRLTTDEYAVVTRNLKAGVTAGQVAQEAADAVIKEVMSAAGTLGRDRGPAGTMPDEATRSFQALLMWDFIGRLGPGAKVLLTEARETSWSAGLEWLKWMSRTQGSIAAPDISAPADMQGATSPVANLGGKHRRASARQTQGAI